MIAHPSGKRLLRNNQDLISVRTKVNAASHAEANKYLGVTPYDNNNMRSRVSPTAYAIKQGVFYTSKIWTEDGDRAGMWWLRSPGYDQESAAYVHPEGSLNNWDVNFNDNDIAVCVRPALWINLESDNLQLQPSTFFINNTIEPQESEDESNYIPTFNLSFWTLPHFGKKSISEIYNDPIQRARFAYCMFSDYADEDDDYEEHFSEYLMNGSLAVGKSSFMMYVIYVGEESSVLLFYIPGLGFDFDRGNYIKYYGTPEQALEQMNAFINQNIDEIESVRFSEVLQAMKWLAGME